MFGVIEKELLSNGQVPMFYNYFHSSIWNEKELSVSSLTLGKKIKFSALEKQTKIIKSVLFGGTYVYMLHVLCIVPPLVLCYGLRVQGVKILGC